MQNVGFDLDAATERLLDEALSVLEASENPGGRDPLMVAMAHVGRHGVGEVGHCEKQPCRAGGLCFALFELGTYQAERGDGPRGSLLRAAEESERLRVALASAAKPYARAVGALSRHARETHELEKNLKHTPAHPHEEVCVTPPRLVAQVLLLLMGLNQSSVSLRAILDSTELRQPGTGDKPSQLLRRAVYQHLRWGGLSHREIATLIPDGMSEDGAAERVRRLVRQGDARSLYPGPLPDETDESSGDDSSG